MRTMFILMLNDSEMRKRKSKKRRKDRPWNVMNVREGLSMTGLDSNKAVTRF